jgi:large subunit ribosomal protein L24
MHIKKGDEIRVLSGDDRGKVGKVLRALPRHDLVVVEGVHVVKRHQRPRRSGQKGQIIEVALPIHASKVALAARGSPSRPKRRENPGTAK